MSDVLDDLDSLKNLLTDEGRHLSAAIVNDGIREMKRLQAIIAHIQKYDASRLEAAMFAVERENGDAT
jgi:hypothetical protein